MLQRIRGMLSLVDIKSAQPTIPIDTLVTGMEEVASGKVKQGGRQDCQAGLGT